MMPLREREPNPTQARRQRRSTDLDARNLVIVVSLSAVMWGLAAILLIRTLG